MAKQIAENTNTSGGYSNGETKQRKADAWGNIQLKAADGSIINFSSGTNPIYSEQNQLHRSLYNAAVTAGGEVEIEAKFIVKVAPKDDGSDIQF